ncbi:MAG: hypothetical protein OEW60_07550, partial [Thiovulaceae bacterium]|nr:hypothetical protein [Sulfurimonadaceae bacterium]
LNSVAYNGVDTFMAVGDVGDYYTSSNGVSWTKQTTLSNTPNLKKIIYANSQFVAVGTDYICSGTTQLSCTNEVGAFNDITYNGSTFVAVGEAGLIFTSSTGTHNDFSKPWFTSGIDSLDILSIGVFDNTFYLSTNGTSSQQSLYSSSDGSTWTKIISENFNTFALIQADDILIGGSTAGSFSYTRDFTTHKTSAYDVAGSVNDLIFTSKIVSVGDSGLVLVSE